MNNGEHGLSQLFSREHYKPSSITRLLVLLALTGFTVTEPLLTIFGSEPSLFLFYNIDHLPPLILYAFVIAIIPAALLWIASLIFVLAGSRASTLAYYFLIFSLFALWLIQLGKWNLGVFRPELLLLLALSGAALLLLAYIKWAFVVALLKIAAIAPIISIVFFLQFSEVAGLADKNEVEITPAKLDQKLPSVLFVLLDEFPTMALFDEQGKLDKVRFPNLAMFSEEATWYRHYTVLADITDLSVPSILSGTDPVKKAPIQAQFPENLFTLLAPTHFLTVFETATQLCGLEQCSELAPGAIGKSPPPKWRKILLKTYSLMTERVALQKPSAPKFDDFEEELVVESPKSGDAFNKFLVTVFLDPTYSVKKSRRLEDFVETFVPAPKPALYFLHVELPHMPWRFYEAGETYSVPTTRFPFSSRNDDGGEWVAAVSAYRFMQQAQYTDKLLGDIIDRMKSLDMWEELLVVVTADHGRSFRLETDGRNLQQENIGSIAYAPLIIKRPYQSTGNIDDSNMMAYDLVPALADVLGIEIPWQSKGCPPGHKCIADRGDEKVFFPSLTPDRTNAANAFFAGKLGQNLAFSDSDNFPKYSSRWILQGESEANPLAALNARLGLDPYWGNTPENFAVKPGGVAFVDQLESLRNPRTDIPPLGLVVGKIESKIKASKVLVAINGHFVTGSPMLTFNGINKSFIAMLPVGALSRQNDIGIYLVDENGLLELTIQ